MDAFLERFVGGVWLTVQFAETLGITVVLAPLFKAAHAEEVAVILKQFFEAGAGDVREFDFGFFGSARSLAAFKNILFAGAGGLNHLVVGAVAFFQVAATEPNGAVLDNPGFLEGEEVFVTAMRRNEVGAHGV